MKHEWQAHIIDDLDPSTDHTRSHNAVHADYYDDDSLRDMPKELQPSVNYDEIKPSSRAGQAKASIQESNKAVQKKKG